MTPAQIGLAVLLVGAMLYTVYGYPHHYGALTGRSRLFRTVGLVVIDLLLVLVLMGMSIDFKADVTPQIAVLRAALYWGACVILGLSLPCIALLDALESYTAVRREKRDFMQQMIQEEIEKVQARAGQTKAEKEDDNVVPRSDNAVSRSNKTDSE
jgi:hypothetical protein